MIRIIVEGQPASGKTTIALALAIHDFLKEKGFTNASIDDIDVQYQSESRHFQSRRLEAIKDREVVVQTKQLPRKTV